ncbi:MAG: hypothetical protein RL020_2033, partial [Pseudomonadota bacterium]
MVPMVKAMEISLMATLMFLFSLAACSEQAMMARVSKQPATAPSKNTAGQCIHDKPLDNISAPATPISALAAEAKLTPYLSLSQPNG